MSDACLFADIAQKAHGILTQHVKSNLQSKVYQSEKVKSWTEEIMAACTRDLSKLSPNFKYIVSCLILENKGVGLHNGTSPSTPNVFVRLVQC